MLRRGDIGKLGQLESSMKDVVGFMECTEVGGVGGCMSVGEVGGSSIPSRLWGTGADVGEETSEALDKTPWSGAEVIHDTTGN